jgi:DNA-binding NtrC family response regulator
MDEIGQFSPDQQAMLLRVMDGDYKRLGEPISRPCNVRVVAATNKPPSALKHDFLRRFPFHIEVPSLDSRQADIPILVRHIIQREFDKGTNKLARDPDAPEGVLRPRPVPQTVIEALLRLSWKDGNVGALEGKLFELLRGAGKAQVEADTALRIDLVKAALVECKGNVTEVGRKFGRTREQLVHFIKTEGLEAFLAWTRTLK